MPGLQPGDLGNKPPGAVRMRMLPVAGKPAMITWIGNSHNLCTAQAVDGTWVTGTVYKAGGLWWGEAFGITGSRCSSTHKAFAIGWVEGLIESRIREIGGAHEDRMWFDEGRRARYANRGFEHERKGEHPR